MDSSDAMSHRSSTLSNFAQLMVVTIFMVMFFLMASVGTYIFFVRPIVQVIDARGWATVPCDIVYSKVERQHLAFTIINPAPRPHQFLLTEAGVFHHRLDIVIGPEMQEGQAYCEPGPYQ